MVGLFMVRENPDHYVNRHRSGAADRDIAFVCYDGEHGEGDDRMETRPPDAGAPVIPTPHDVALAEASSRVLAQHLPTPPADGQLRLVEEGHETEVVTVPAAALTLFLRLL